MHAAELVVETWMPMGWLGANRPSPPRAAVSFAPRPVHTHNHLLAQLPHGPVARLSSRPALSLASPMARRLLLLAPARRHRGFWLASWSAADPDAAAAAPAQSPDTRKKNPLSSSSSSAAAAQHRLGNVVDAVNERKLPPELRGRPNAVRSETDIINVVEQRIWHSMEEGHFENLPGKGKPLNLDTNPHADPAEDTLYRILSKNGCAPEWVELNKEIRGMIAGWRSALRKSWANRLEDDGSAWHYKCNALQERIRQINDKVFRYNLIVPFGRQMSGLSWEKELDKLKIKQDKSTRLPTNT